MTKPEYVRQFTAVVVLGAIFLLSFALVLAEAWVAPVIEDDGEDER